MTLKRKARIRIILIVVVFLSINKADIPRQNTIESSIETNIVKHHVPKNINISRYIILQLGEGGPGGLG